MSKSHAKRCERCDYLESKIELLNQEVLTLKNHIQKVIQNVILT